MSSQYWGDEYHIRPAPFPAPEALTGIVMVAPIDRAYVAEVCSYLAMMLNEDTWLGSDTDVQNAIQAIQDFMADLNSELYIFFPDNLLLDEDGETITNADDEPIEV